MNQATETPIKTDIPMRERLIFALDVPDLDRARQLVETLGDSVLFYKLGLEFFLSGHYFDLAAELRARDKKIFADLKLFDIPATVASAVEAMRHGVYDYLEKPLQADELERLVSRALHKAVRVLL